MSFRSRYCVVTSLLLVLPQLCLSQAPAAPILSLPSSFPRSVAQPAPAQPALMLPVSIAQDAAVLRQTVADLEANGDTWHPQIAESMTSLARLMQQAGEHEEALGMLERAVHISRVNNGLFSLQQVPALDLQVDSHMALNQWAEADSLRQYHFFIHSRSMQQNDPELIPALIKYAEWHVQSYHDKRVDVTSITRLIDAYQLYSVALSLAEAQPEPGMWPRERYLQRTAYLAWQLSLVSPQMRSKDMYARSRQVDDAWVDHMTNGQNTLRASTFAMGEEALERIIALREAHLLNAPPDSSVRRDLLKQHVESVLQLADWHLLFSRRNASSEIYRQAWQMLADEDEALRREIFGGVVVIPVFDEYLQPELLQKAPNQASELAYALAASASRPAMPARDEWPWADMRFDLSRFGRVSNVELVNASTDISENVRRLVITSLSSTPMRPYITASGLQGSEDWLYRFPYDPGRTTNNLPDVVSNEGSEQAVGRASGAAAIESAAFQAQ